MYLIILAGVLRTDREIIETTLLPNLDCVYNGRRRLNARVDSTPSSLTLTFLTIACFAERNISRTTVGWTLRVGPLLENFSRQSIKKHCNAQNNQSDLLEFDFD